MEKIETIFEQELLPGLPDAVVTHSILPRLRWYTRPRMQAVSKAWKAAMENHKLFEPRTQEVYKPTGIFVIHEIPSALACEVSGDQSTDFHITSCLSSQDSDDESSDVFLLRKYAIEMYDTHCGSWHRLPPIQLYPSMIPSRCSFICMNGKLYVMGGVPDSRKERESGEMHMLNVGLESHTQADHDLIACLVHAYVHQGHWWWEKCASMHFSRAYVKCVAREGHIYVAGGTCPAEVYDVSEDQWYRLPEMVDPQFFCNGILALHTQILAYGYDILDPEVFVEPDINSARVYDLLSRSWSSVGFDFTKCCTSIESGRLMFDIIDGTLITYDTTTHMSTIFDGKLHGEVNPEDQTSSNMSTQKLFCCRTEFCHIFDLIALEIPDKDLQVYTLSSQFGCTLRQLWHGTLDFDACKVTWNQLDNCPFQLGQLESENLSEICSLHST